MEICASNQLAVAFTLNFIKVGPMTEQPDWLAVTLRSSSSKHQDSQRKTEIKKDLIGVCFTHTSLR